MCFPLVLLLVGQLEYHPVQVVLKGLVLCVLPVELRVVPEHRRYLPLQGRVMFNLCVLPCPECIFAFWYASSSFTRSGMSLIISVMWSGLLNEFPRFC